MLNVATPIAGSLPFVRVHLFFRTKKNERNIIAIVEFVPSTGGNIL